MTGNASTKERIREEESHRKTHHNETKGAETRVRDATARSRPERTIQKGTRKTTESTTTT
jgi:hypothetical protein